MPPSTAAAAARTETRTEACGVGRRSRRCMIPSHLLLRALLRFSSIRASCSSLHTSAIAVIVAVPVLAVVASAARRFLDRALLLFPSILARCSAVSPVVVNGRHRRQGHRSGADAAAPSAKTAAASQSMPQPPWLSRRGDDPPRPSSGAISILDRRTDGDDNDLRDDHAVVNLIVIKCGVSDTIQKDRFLK